MIDIHCHILPGVDDGAQSLEEACAMVEIAAADGITQVVATPHCNARYPSSLERNLTLLAELGAATGGRLLLSSGCDFHLSYENLERVLADPSPYAINQRTY
ncbi:MAG: CpsB/CapC family capsule biosynthesis tyrosine phosphatase, partial [Terriglobia bacterium]